MIKYILILTSTLMLAGCASRDVHPDRAGCSYLDGEGRYGTLFNYLKGDAEGAHIYVGSNLQGKVYIICDKQSQQIILNSVVPDLPEWIEDVPISTEGI